LPNSAVSSSASLLADRLSRRHHGKDVTEKTSGQIQNEDRTRKLQEDETKRLDAENLLAKGLNAAGLISDELAALKGSDPRKVAIAIRLWREGGVSQK